MTPDLMRLALAAMAGLVVGVAATLALRRIMHRRALRSVAEAEAAQTLQLAPPRPEAFDEPFFRAALVEQFRRERMHGVEYRPDQRINAIQQRLSRRWGKAAAFTPATLTRIKEALHGVADQD